MTTLKIAQVVNDIPTSLIEPDPHQPRKAFDPEYIAGLGQSIKTEGLLQPITVRKNPEKPGHFLIVAGECRWRGHCHAGLESVKCIVSAKLDDEVARFRAQVMENMGRKDMTFREEATAIAKCKSLGDDDARIASALGLTPYRVKNIFRLTKLPENVWTMMSSGIIHRKVAECAAGIIETDSGLEQILMQGAGKTLAVGLSIIDVYIDEQNQTKFALVCEEAGIAVRKDELERRLAEHVMAISSIVAKLDNPKQHMLGRLSGKAAAKMLTNTKHNIHAARFLVNAFNCVKVALESKG